MESDRFYLINLYDFYGELLTKKQQQYFEDYYFQNLSLFEISENYSISRNAVYNRLKESEEKLLFYENHLKCYEKKQKLEQIIRRLPLTEQKWFENIEGCDQ